MNAEIARMILNGQCFAFTVTGNEKEVFDFWGWLKQFKGAYCGQQNLISSSSSPIQGGERLSVSVGQLPINLRQLLAGTIAEWKSCEFKVKNGVGI